MTPNAARTGRVLALPASGIFYNECLYRAARARGIEVVAAEWSGRWLLRHARPGDLLHLHWPSFHYYAPTSRTKTAVGLARFVTVTALLKRRGVQIAWTAHNLYPHDGGRGKLSHRLARRHVVRIADEIFAHGRTAAEIVAREFGVPRSKLTVIPHGHWIGAYPNTVRRDDARSELRIPEGAFAYLFIGLCKPYKGLEELLDSVARSANPGGYLVIAGKFQSPAYREVIEARAREIGTDRIGIHAGFVADDRIQTFLNAADAVVLPYRDILTSGAAMLAMSFGRPVIAPRLGSLGDFVDDACGFLYDPTAPDALGTALRAVRERAFDADEIVRRVSRFTWDDAARVLDPRESPTRAEESG